MSHNILIVEDNLDLVRLLELHLKDLDYQVEHVLDGTLGLQKALSGRYNLIILDIMLPGVNGLELCKELRRAPFYTPILILTSRSSDLDRILGLELGADDYVTKPFNIMELMARVKAIFRRVENIQATGNNREETVLRKDNLFIDSRKRQVTINNEEIYLTAREFDLLQFFAKNPGQVFTRSQLLKNVWGYGHDGYEHTVNSHINRLRSKLETNPTTPQYILTVWGVGYKFADL